MDELLNWECDWRKGYKLGTNNRLGQEKHKGKWKCTNRDKKDISPECGRKSQSLRERSSWTSFHIPPEAFRAPWVGWNAQPFNARCMSCSSSISHLESDLVNCETADQIIHSLLPGQWYIIKWIWQCFPFQVHRSLWLLPMNFIRRSDYSRLQQDEWQRYMKDEHRSFESWCSHNPCNEYCIHFILLTKIIISILVLFPQASFSLTCLLITTLTTLQHCLLTIIIIIILTSTSLLGFI